MSLAVAKRASVLVIGAFAGCTMCDHQMCLEFISIRGPCSWAHSAWKACIIFASSAFITCALLGVTLWILWPTIRKAREVR